MNGTLYVPVKDIAGVLGGSVDWDNDTKTATVNIDPWSATVDVGEQQAQVNGTPVRFSAPLVNEDGTLWVPAEFFHAAFGYEVEVNGKSVTVTNPNAPLLTP
jgi:hypothetical protein